MSSRATGAVGVDAFDNVFVGNQPLDSGTLSITQGGAIDFATVFIGGQATEAGTVLVSGAGSVLETKGVNNGVFVGGLGGGGAGTLTVAAGATLKTHDLQSRGSNGDTGVITVTGVGSTIILSNDGGRFSAPFDYEAGFLLVARNAGEQGEINVLDGGRIEIRSGIGVNEDTTVPGFQLARNAGSTGSMLIDGAGSMDGGIHMPVRSAAMLPIRSSMMPARLASSSA